MIKKIVILTLLVFFLGQFNYAQERLVTKGDEKYNEYSFTLAIDIYKKVLDKGYVSADLLKRLGDSYYFNADYQEASNTYKKLVDGYAADIGPEYYFRYAQTLKSLGDYDGSNGIMEKFIQITSDDIRAMAFKGKGNYLEDIRKNSGRYDL